MLEKSENRVGLLLNLPVEINIYFRNRLQDHKPVTILYMQL